MTSGDRGPLAAAFRPTSAGEEARPAEAHAVSAGRHPSSHDDRSPPAGERERPKQCDADSVIKQCVPKLQSKNGLEGRLYCPDNRLRNN